jgi:membrane protein implicated in regulation of membrane protease activity
MSGWVLWAVAACAFGLGEMLTNGFFLAPFAVGALLAAGVDATGAPEVAAWIAFVAVSLLTLVVIRPIAIAHRRTAPELRTGAAALIGKQAIVIEPGKRVHVLAIKGATALVSE